MTDPVRYAAKATHDAHEAKRAAARADRHARRHPNDQAAQDAAQRAIDDAIDADRVAIAARRRAAQA